MEEKRRKEEFYNEYSIQHRNTVEWYNTIIPSIY